ncbi:MAG: hypothetical protein H6550_13825 [Chitinophagales bacterium]|nr:hypothetical protein [Chitinophagales bacterium]
MTWFDNIQDLQFYHQPKGVPCYCEMIVYPTDLILQGNGISGSGNYILKLYVYSADGLTQYEDATTYFDYYFGVMPGGGHFFNARLRSFSPAMCAHECYVLRAEVVQSGGITVFNKYTERYCQNNCCDVPTGINFQQDGYAIDTSTTEDVVSLNDVSQNLYVPVGNCGEPLLRIISEFDCIDSFTGDFFGVPDTVLSGTADFKFTKVTTLRGRIVRRPRSIKRDISYNCKLQRSESAAQYLLEGFEYLPAWKMYEIEGQLHGNRIYIDDFSGAREYQYAGGTPFKQISKCFELFKLETTLEDCTQRQIFGCGACEEQLNFDGSNKIFAIPADYDEGGFYNSLKEKIADDYEGLMDYFSTRNGALGVSDIDTGTMNCSAYKVLAVSSVGQIDSCLYYDSPVIAHRITGLVVDDINDLCDYLPAICVKPATSAFTVTVPACATPTYDVFTVEDTDTDDVSVNGYHNWVKDEENTHASIYNNEVTLNLEVVNAEITEDPADPGEPVLVNDIIGVVGTNGRPATMVVLNSANSTLDDNVTVSIDASGVIKYYGPSSTASSTEISIQLINLKYNI